MADVLASRSPSEVAAWYGRLADTIAARMPVGNAQPTLPNHVEPDKPLTGFLAWAPGQPPTGSLAAYLLRHWLQNRDPKEKHTFSAPDHLRGNSLVGQALQFHRKVYLTEEKARLGVAGHQSTKWAGIIPRLQGKAGFTKWDGKGTLSLTYESLVEFPMALQLKALSMLSLGTDAGGDLGSIDLFFGLHGFQVKSKVGVTAAPVSGSGKLKIMFVSFEAQVIDRYDWDYSEHLTVPNPDFESTSPGAIDAKSKSLTVYHSNAKRVEDAKLAAPYDIETNTWTVSDSGITAPAVIDPAKSLGWL